MFFTFYIFLAGFLFSLEIAHAGESLEARDLYLTKCAKCHKLYDPSGYDDAEWGRWMGKMRKKAHLDSEEYNLIVTYCDSLRKSAPPPAAKNPISPTVKFNDIIPLIK